MYISCPLFYSTTCCLGLEFFVILVIQGILDDEGIKETIWQAFYKAPIYFGKAILIYIRESIWNHVFFPFIPSFLSIMLDIFEFFDFIYVIQKLLDYPSLAFVVKSLTLRDKC